MTLQADTVSNILQDVSDLRGETTVNTDADRIRAVSRAERSIAKRKMFVEHLRRLVSDTGDGTNDYEIGDATYPMRKKGLSEVFVGGTGEENRYQVVDYFVYQNLYNNNNAERMAYEWYDQANDLFKVHINPAPETGEAIYYSYYYTPPKRTATSDVVICPDMEALARLTAAYIYEGEEEDEKAILLKREAENIIGELLGLENMPAQNQLKAMGSITNQITPRGLGSY